MFVTKVTTMLRVYLISSCNFKANKPISRVHDRDILLFNNGQCITNSKINSTYVCACMHVCVVLCVCVCVLCVCCVRVCMRACV